MHSVCKAEDKGFLSSGASWVLRAQIVLECEDLSPDGRWEGRFALAGWGGGGQRGWLSGRRTLAFSGKQKPNQRKAVLHLGQRSPVSQCSRPGGGKRAWWGLRRAGGATSVQ